MAERQKGKVQWFNDAQGFGFIRPANGNKDVFVHYSGIRRDGFKTLTKDDDVEYEVVPGKKGLEAVEVVRL